MPRRCLTLALAAPLALAFAACAPAAQDEGGFQVVASTNVYAQIASEIGGDAIEVSSIVKGGAGDPHAYEPTVKDRVEVTKADLVIRNGAGYDSFIDAMLDGSDAAVLTVTAYAPDLAAAEDADHDHAEDEHAEDEHDHEHAEDEGDHAGHDHIEGFNEHVWYDLDVVADFAQALSDELVAALPEDAEAIRANTTAFLGEIDGLREAQSALAAAHPDTHVFVTEPIPLRLTDPAGLHNVAPATFTEAVEEGQDVPPAVVLEADALLKDEDVKLVITNTQAGGAETDHVVASAEALGIPVITFSELIPADTTYEAWMHSNIDQITQALSA